MDYLKLIFAIVGLIGIGYIISELLSIPKSLKEIALNLQEINASLREIIKESKKSSKQQSEKNR